MTDQALVAQFAKRVRELAFKIPAPNPWTPQLVQLCVEFQAQCEARRPPVAEGAVERAASIVQKMYELSIELTDLEAVRLRSALTSMPALVPAAPAIDPAEVMRLAEAWVRAASAYGDGPAVDAVKAAEQAFRAYWSGLGTGGRGDGSVTEPICGRWRGR